MTTIEIHDNDEAHIIRNDNERFRFVSVSYLERSFQSARCLIASLAYRCDTDWGACLSGQLYARIPAAYL